MDFYPETGGLVPPAPSSCAKPAVVKGAPRSVMNTNGLRSLSRCSRRRARISGPLTGWTLGVPCLTRRTCKHGTIKIDLIPPKVRQFRGPQPMPEGDKDHGGVTMPVAVLSCRCHQRLDFVLGQVFARAQIAVLRPLRCDCSFSVLGAIKLETRLSHENWSLVGTTVAKNGSFTNSRPRALTLRLPLARQAPSREGSPRPWKPCCRR